MAGAASQGDAYSSRAPGPTSSLLGVRRCLIFCSIVSAVEIIVRIFFNSFVLHLCPLPCGARKKVPREGFDNKDQYEYNLPWLYSGSINSSLTHIKCDNREFVALQKGKYTIHVKIHIDTYQHRTLDHNKQYPLRLCMMSDDKVLHCSVKRQASKEVDTMELNQIIDMEDGQKFSFLLRTDEKPRNVIKKYHNRVQIHKNDCHPLKSSNK
ncbi:hypothetical protein FSP39_017206 [Pinctada imbricata]|uniref:Uncharacterized protein n=1 Tax=Pinctada imbricata TaxID=66713 RepID=A0AA89BTV0_PINIB|nr:hypothetical protein FSP39_017206 [Pinctada imbricata]